MASATADQYRARSKSPNPASAMNDRHTSSTSRAPTPARTAATISPPGASRAARPPTASADQMQPSASRAQPSGANFSSASVCSKESKLGSGSICPHSVRSVSEPSSAMSNAVRVPVKDSEMIRVRLSGVTTIPLGNSMSPATSRAG